MGRAYSALLLLGTAALGCSVDGGKDTPPVSAMQGSPIQVDGPTQKVSIDTTRVPVLDSCESGFVRRKPDRSGWECVTDVPVNSAETPVVPSCGTGQIVSKTATGWTCVNPPEGVDESATPVVMNCAAGELVRKTASGWDCVAPTPELNPAQTPVVAACAAGQIVRKTATGWDCVLPPAEVNPSATPVLASCGVGQVVRKTLSGWDCVTPAPGLDPTTTPSVDRCSIGQIVAKTSLGWGCIDLPPEFNAATLAVAGTINQAGNPVDWTRLKNVPSGFADGVDDGVDPAKTPVVLSCATGQVPRKTASGWDCYAPTEVDIARTPVVSGCSSGQIVRKTVSGWECADSPTTTIVQEADLAAGDCMTVSHPFGTAPVLVTVAAKVALSNEWAPQQIPKDTSESIDLSGATITASSSMAGTSPGDGAYSPNNADRYWASSKGATWKVDFGRSVRLGRFSVRGDMYDPVTFVRHHATAIGVRFSIDGSTWTPKFSISDNYSPGFFYYWSGSNINYPVGVYVRFIELSVDATVPAETTFTNACTSSGSPARCKTSGLGSFSYFQASSVVPYVMNLDGQVRYCTTPDTNATVTDHVRVAVSRQ